MRLEAMRMELMDLIGNGIQAAIAVTSLAALALSIWTQRKMSHLSSMQFPGVTAEFAGTHKAGPRDGAPPVVRDMQEIRLTLTDRSDQFVIADVKLTPWEAYWTHYLLQHDGSGALGRIFVQRFKRKLSMLPQFLRVKVERKGGVQAASWQKVRIERAPDGKPGEPVLLPPPVVTAKIARSKRARQADV
jgi:hypothetical protein